MTIQPQPAKAGDRVHYCAWYLGLNDGRRYRAYAMRKLGESDLDAVLRSIGRRLDAHGFEIGKHTSLDDGTTKFAVLFRLARGVLEDFGEGALELHRPPDN